MKRRMGRTAPTSLEVVLKLLPTPRTNDANGAGAHGTGGDDLRTVARLLPTPNTRDRYVPRDGRLASSLAREAQSRGWECYGAAISRWEVLTRPAPPPLDEKERLNLAFVEWMMGAPEGWTEGLSRTAAIHGLGNGVVVQVAEVVGAWALDGLKGLEAME